MMMVISCGIVTFVAIVSTIDYCVNYEEYNGTRNTCRL